MTVLANSDSEMQRFEASRPQAGSLSRQAERPVDDFPRRPQNARQCDIYAPARTGAHRLSACLMSMRAAWCAAIGAPSCATAFIAARTASMCELIMSVVLRAAST
jgi:hypothetical protein